MEKNYISEFTVFMNRYLKEHPEVVKDQERGRNIYWNPKLEPEELKPPQKELRIKR
jgi:hypothetical protein